MASRKRTGARRCRHRRFFSANNGALRLCWECRAQLPFGPARDDGEHAERIKVEQRAAELAADGGRQWMIECDDLGPDDVEQCELCGWDDHEIGLPCPDGAAAAGWLARCIATHDAEVDRTDRDRLPE